MTSKVKGDHFQNEIITEKTDENEMDTTKDTDDGNMFVKKYLLMCKRLKIVPSTKVRNGLLTNEICLNHRNIGPLGLQALASGLEQNPTVEKVDLEDNGIGIAGSVHIGKLLTKNYRITFLNLSNNNLGSAAAEVIGQALQTNTSIECLLLSGNGFEDKDCQALADGIERNEFIEELDLSHNSFSEYGAKALGKAIAKNVSIKKLDLSWNKIRKTGSVAICKGVKDNSKLLAVNFAWNGFGYEGALAVRELLKTNKILQHLTISNNNINWDGALLISHGLKENTALKTIMIGHNPLGIQGCLDLLRSVLANPKSNLHRLSVEDVRVNKVVLELSAQIKHVHYFDFIHGVVQESDDVLGRKKDKRNAPLELLSQYLTEKNMRVLELFRTFDKSSCNIVPKKQFIKGLKDCGVPLRKYEVIELVESLDSSKQETISYQALLQAIHNTRRISREQKKKMMRRKSERSMVHKSIMDVSVKLPDIKENSIVNSSTPSCSYQKPLVMRRHTSNSDGLMPILPLNMFHDGRKKKSNSDISESNHRLSKTLTKESIDIKSYLEKEGI